MKKLVLLLAITTMLAGMANAQNFYLKAGGGYIFRAGSSAYNNADPNNLTSIQPSTSIVINADGSMASVKSLNGTLGTGYKFGLSGGYQFTKNMAVELAINRFQGKSTTIGEFKSPLANEKEVAYVRGFDISPTVVIKASENKVTPYVRAGLIFTGPGSLWIRTTVDEPNGGGQGTDIAVKAKSQVKSEFSAGLLGAAGLTLNVCKRWSVFGEAEYKTFSITSKSAKITEFSTTATTGGTAQPVPGRQLADLAVYQKSFVFSDKFQQPTNSSAIDVNQPRVLPTQKVNLSGVGINVGLIRRF